MDEPWAIVAAAGVGALAGAIGGILSWLRDAKREKRNVEEARATALLTAYSEWFGELSYVVMVAGQAMLHSGVPGDSDSNALLSAAREWTSQIGQPSRTAGAASSRVRLLERRDHARKKSDHLSETFSQLMIATLAASLGAQSEDVAKATSAFYSEKEQFSDWLADTTFAK